MAYSQLNELPETVKQALPEHAQEMYKEAFLLFHALWHWHCNIY